MSQQHWYDWTDPEDGGDYFLVFVNALGSSSMRAYDGSSEIALTLAGRDVIRKPGEQYEQAFSDYLRSAQLLARAEDETWRPNLQRACRYRLPREVLVTLQKRRLR